MPGEDALCATGLKVHTSAHIASPISLHQYFRRILWYFSSCSVKCCQTHRDVCTIKPPGTTNQLSSSPEFLKACTPPALDSDDTSFFLVSQAKLSRLGLFLALQQYFHPLSSQFGTNPKASCTTRLSAVHSRHLFIRRSRARAR